MSTPDKATDFPFGANATQNDEQPELPFDQNPAAPTPDQAPETPQKPAEAPQSASEAPEAPEDAQEASKPRKGPQKPRKPRSRKGDEFGFFVFLDDLTPPKEGETPHKIRVKLKSTTVKAARLELRQLVAKDSATFANKKVTLVNFIESHVTKQQLVTKLV